MKFVQITVSVDKVAALDEFGRVWLWSFGLQQWMLLPQPTQESN